MKIDKDILNTLIGIGLNEKEAIIYLSGLEIGTCTIQELSSKSKIKRATIYLYIDSLKNNGFFSEIKKGNKRFFVAEPPRLLETYIRNKKQELQKFQNELNNIEFVIPGIISKLEGFYEGGGSSTRPSMRFYEGIEGIKTVLNDSLTSKEEIYTYSNVYGLFKYINDINSEYVENRKIKKVFKKGLVIDTLESRKLLENYDKEVTKIKFLKGLKFNLEMEIYDGKVSYLTFTNNKPVGVIIENKEIYEMQRYLFEFNWNLASD